MVGINYGVCPNCGALVSRGDSDEYGFCHGGHEICGIYLHIPSRFSSGKIAIIKRSDGDGRMVPITWQYFNEMGLAVKRFFALEAKDFQPEIALP